MPACRARVIAQNVTEGLVLALAAAVFGLVVAQTTVRCAWARAGQIGGGIIDGNILILLRVARRSLTADPRAK